MGIYKKIGLSHDTGLNDTASYGILDLDDFQVRFQ